MTFYFLGATLVSNLGYSTITRFLSTTSSFWLGNLLYFVIAACLTLTCHYILKLPALQTGGLFFAAALMVSIYGVLNAMDTQITRYDITIPNLPAEWKSKQIIVVADSHFGQIRGKAFAEKISKLITDQKPDLVLIPGDFFDGPPTDYDAAAVPFGKIPAPVYFANGNHEEFRDSSVYIQALERAGVHILNNKSATINGLQILGVDYFSTTNSEQLSGTLQAISWDKTLPTILIKHSPANISTAAQFPIALQVSGHSHKGQVWPGPLIAEKVYGKFSYGLNYEKSLAVVTTSGVGTWGPPMRVGTKSEIVVLTLK
ncbi:MAG TPA: metallophosphoesterase [Patescibacteria group bacterium]|nr:metallophosphoesterase [Patescibacteria group bacterium]